MSKTATKLNKEDILVENAARYLADRAYRHVVGKSQTLKLRQISKSIDVEGATPRLLRHAMAENDRFETVDRRWAASTRLGDNRRPLERVITEIIQSAGIPVSVETLAGELAQVYGRAVEYYEEALPRVLGDQEKFFSAGDGTYGLASWLLMPTAEEESDVVFDNFFSEDQVEELLLNPNTVLGLSDAGAHASQLCDACLPTYLLGHWVREKQVLSLEQAIRMLTSRPAEVFGIRDRGRLGLGLPADLVVFDPDTVGDGPLERVHDLPGGADRLISRARGVEAVIVNGQVLRRGDADAIDADGALPGKLLRGGQAA